jgi:predicted permease
MVEAIAEFGRRVPALFRSAQIRRDLDEEMRLHLDLRERENRIAGLSFREAQHAAQRKFGNTLQLRERGEDMWGWNWLQNFAQDARYGMRVLLKNPGFSAIAVLTLALGIGANTAIFSVVDAVLLRPLPYKQPDRLVFLMEDSVQVPGMSISMANFNDWRDMNTVFDSMLPCRTTSMIMTGQGDPESLPTRQITAAMVPTLGIQPIIGRSLTAEDDKVGAVPVVILSDSFWARKFGSDPSILGKSLTLSGEAFTVVGVIPSSRFHGSWRRMQLFTSLWRLENSLGGPNQRSEHVGIVSIARMKAGVTLEKATAEMKDIAARLAKQYPETNTGNTVTVQPLLAAVVGDIGTSMWVLLAAVGFVLLISCANVANLMLARATQRHREMAIRTALGARGFRLARQLLTESLLLAIVGGALGLGIAYLTTIVLASAAPPNVPRIETVTVDRWVLLYALGISVLTGLFFGLFPAWNVSRVNVHETIKEGARGGTSGVTRKRVRSSLVVAEVAVSMILLVGAGLTIKSLYRVIHADSGYDPSGVFTTSFSLPQSQYKEFDKQIQFVQQIIEKISEAPGVESVGLENPFLGGSSSSYWIEGRPMPAPGQWPNTDVTSITPNALHASGVRLIRGRFFTDADNSSSPLVIIVDTKMAELAWPGQDAIGKLLNTASLADATHPPKWRTVVGVVSHVAYSGVDRPSDEQTYIPFEQRSAPGGTLVIHSSGDAASVAAIARAAMNSVNRALPLSAVRTLTEIAGDNVAPRRLSVALLSAFAGLALLLAAIGIYGVMSYVVTQRTQEIGIRVALGAQRADIMGMVLRSGMSLLAIGLSIGMAGAFFVGRYIQSLLFQVTPTDALTLVVVPLILALVAFVACYLPARRAMRLDPIIALRFE